MPNYRLEGQSWTIQPITWDFAATTLAQDQADSAFSSMITRQDVQAVVSESFEAWSRGTGMKFVYAPQDNATVDIRIGWGAFPTSAASGGELGETDYSYNTATNAFDPDTVIRLLDPARSALSISGGMLTYGAYDATVYQVVTHEIGHALGLAHDTIDESAIMYPYSSDENRQLAAVDIAGAQAIYGNPAASVIEIGANRETVAGTLSGTPSGPPSATPSTIFGGSGVLDYVGGTGLIVLATGSARIDNGSVTVFASAASLTASNNQSATFILGSAYASIGGGGTGSTDTVFGGSSAFTYAGNQEAADVIGSVGSASITGGSGGGYYSGGSDGSNSLTANGAGSVLVGGGANDTLSAAPTGYTTLVAGSGNETLTSAGSTAGSGLDTFFLGSGGGTVLLGDGTAELVTGAGTATISGGGGHALLFGGTGGSDLYVEQPGGSLDINGFREGTDHVRGTTLASSTTTSSGTVLQFADGATITLNGVTGSSGTSLLG